MLLHNEDEDIEDIEDIDEAPVPNLVDYLDSMCVCLEKRFQAARSKNNIELLKANDCVCNILIRLEEIVDISFVRYVLRRRVNVLYRRDLEAGNAFAEDRIAHHSEFCGYFLER